MKQLRDSRLSSRIAWSIAIILAVVWVINTGLPFIYMVLNSFKEQFEMLQKGIFQLPDSFYLENYATVLTKGIFNYFMNSVIVLAASLGILLFITACASYPLSRMDFKFRALIFGLIVACMSIPSHVALIPVFKMSTRLGIYDTLWALIGPNVAFNIPVSCPQF